LSKEHARARAAEIDVHRTKQHGPAPVGSDTTSFVVAHEEMAVSYIQSIYWPWGSGFTVPSTGVLMNNRMLCFHTDASSPNRIAPRKRAVHTLNTFLVVRDGELVVGGGTPGADFQVQNNLQTIAGVADWGLDLQSAVDAPRWVILPDGRIRMESRFRDETVRGLEARGHSIDLTGAWDNTIARTQVVASRPAGGWAAASDLRGEGVALAL
ncbi:MAG: gamma-glutamyltransferase, partial [Dehalococcoidia bacterium]|nr:gamma-glutamyltransferase [Dehalococcoidia bacterium]